LLDQGVEVRLGTTRDCQIGAQLPQATLLLTIAEAAVMRREGLAVAEKCGVSYNPLEDRWRRSRDLGVNYMLLASKPKGRR
ncbi:MAG: hypothetical protein WD017_00770, partial [Cucumibacter sp.]